MNPKTRTTLFSSASDDWGTPQSVVDAVKRYAPIGLDPCGGPNSVVGAKRTIKPPQDGLAASWKVRPNEVVFVNPPFGPRGKWIPGWIEKAIGEVQETILLVAARTDTRWFHRLFAHALSICFVKGRLHFMVGEHETGPATFPSAIVLLPRGGEPRYPEVLEDSQEAFLTAFQDLGRVVNV